MNEKKNIKLKTSERIQAIGWCKQYKQVIWIFQLLVKARAGVLQRDIQDVVLYPLSPVIANSIAFCNKLIKIEQYADTCIVIQLYTFKLIKHLHNEAKDQGH